MPKIEEFRGVFKSDSRYARAMKDAGISHVTLANNHMFDAGEKGLVETMSNLEHAGIAYSGAGTNLEDARSAKIHEIKGLKCIILSYT